MRTPLPLILFVLALMLCAARAGDGAPAHELASELRAAPLPRAEKVARIEQWLDRNPDDAGRFELVRLLAELYDGMHCSDPPDWDAWRRQMQRLASDFPNEAMTNIGSLHMLVTYAQTIADAEPEKSRALLMSILETESRNIVVPADYIWATLGREESVNRLKQGVIWAMLNDRTSHVNTERDDRKRNAAYRQAYEELAEKLSATAEGRRCLPLATWWRDVVMADDLSTVTRPRLERSEPLPSDSREIPASEIIRERQNRQERPPDPPESEPQYRNFELPSIDIAGPASKPWTVERTGSDTGGGSAATWIAAGLAALGLTLIVVGNIRRNSS